MANDTTKTAVVRDAAKKAPDKQTSGQIDPKSEKAATPDLAAKGPPPPACKDKRRLR